MKKLFIILTLIFFGCVWGRTSVAEDNGCTAPRKPLIRFSTSYGLLQYDKSRTVDEITQMSLEYGRREQGVFLSGLATVIVEKEYEFGTSGEALRGGKMCVFPSVINVFVGYTRPMIYIAKSLRPGSCEYNLVLRHEQTHQLINKKALDYFLPRFKAAAEKIALEIKPQKVSSSTEMASVTQKMTDEFAVRMNKVVAVFEKELYIEQGKLDNKINYSMEENICRKFNATH